jgi:hypothetical protein
MADRRARRLLIPVLYLLALGFVFLAAYVFLGTAEPRGARTVPGHAETDIQRTP